MPQVRYLLLAAACHVTLTTAIFLIGHFHVLPNTFDENGTGLTFAIDGATYQRVASGLVDEVHTNGFVAWLNAKAPLHSRLYSLSFATFGALLGHNILAAEPLNLFYYLAILVCVYLLGRETFDAETGFVAAAIVAVWPSFLLHSTQLIRDPLAISCLLALMLVLTIVLSRELAWRQTVGFAIAGALLVSLFWLARGNMWNIVLVAIATTVVILFCRTIRDNRFMARNAVVMTVIIAAALLVPGRLESTTLEGVRPPVTPLAIPSASGGVLRTDPWTATINQISQRRAGFRFYNSRASDIDSEVRFKSASDIVKFIPRAFVIGFFAPFPKMWVQTGSFGLATRVLSGLETLAMYFLYLAAALCVWRERRNLKMWLLVSVALIGMVALGLVVVNAGALFRIRYVFWILLIVIASRYLTVSFTKLMKSRMSSSVVSNDAINRTSEISGSQT
jgi:4-amino-4-deoxy-L-arabinose transferase-like glycosyltransferase